MSRLDRSDQVPVAGGLRYPMDSGYILATSGKLVGLWQKGRTGRVMVLGSDPTQAKVLVDR